MNEEIFESFIDKPVQVPSRSHLNPVCQIGSETGMVQSLPSYIHHVAASHSLPTWVLACRILAPCFTRPTVATARGHCDLFGAMGTSTVGNNRTAAEMVAILEQLTSVAGLGSSTLLKFGTAVAGPLIRPRQAWCSACLVDFRRMHHGVYQPLFWSIRDVNACPIHSIRLETECPNCFKAHRPLTRYRWNGNCPRCNKQFDQGRPRQASDWELRVARRAVEAIGALQQLKTPFNSSNFSTNIQELTTCFSGGNSAKLARQIRVHHSNIHEWGTAKQLPSLSSLFRVSATFEIPALDWIQKRIQFSARSFERLLPVDAKQPFRRRNLMKLRGDLQTQTNSDQSPPRSFAQICKDLGTEQTFMARKFPELAQVFIKRRKQYLWIKKQAAGQFEKLVVRATFDNLLCSGIRPTSTQMAKALPRGIALRDRDALNEFNRLRSELSTKLPEIVGPTRRYATRVDAKNTVAAPGSEP